MRLRELNWPADAQAVQALDTAYDAMRVYRLERRGFDVALREVSANTPIHKNYSLGAHLDELRSCDWVQVAVDADLIVGLAAMRMEAWNRRAELCHLYVDSTVRRRGVGRGLVSAAAHAARGLGARALWVETQTTNAAAVDFYQRVGFVWCGFDSSLYDPVQVSDSETALFFSMNL